MKVIRPSSKELEKIYNRAMQRRKRVEIVVTKIVNEVRLAGDDALIKFTKRFDKVKLQPRNLKVTEAEVSGAYQNIKPEFAANLKSVIDNISRFYQKQLHKSWKIKGDDGIILGERLNPIDCVGVYVPSGTAPLVSSVYMSVIPAKIAGVKRIVLATPPNKEGFINPYILAVADLLKVNEIYKVGGAQAIAAMAFGTKTIKKVDKIVGPGNAYVTEAKRQVFGYVDIDMTAGPTELVIIAGSSVPVSFIKADLESQMEHAGGLSILVTSSKKLIKDLRKQIPKGYIIQAKNLKEAVEIVNKIAPEHLEIMVKNPNRIIKGIRHAGAIFIGPYSPTAVGDYVAGPSHVLPTSGTARFFSGLSVNDFIKGSHIIQYSKKALEKSRAALEDIASIEGLSKHLESVKIRFDT